jgi:hypothetical protein
LQVCLTEMAAASGGFYQQPRCVCAHMCWMCGNIISDVWGSTCGACCKWQHSCVFEASVIFVQWQHVCVCVSICNICAVAACVCVCVSASVVFVQWQHMCVFVSAAVPVCGPANISTVCKSIPCVELHLHLRVLCGAISPAAAVLQPPACSGAAWTQSVACLLHCNCNMQAAGAGGGPAGNVQRRHPAGDQ